MRDRRPFPRRSGSKTDHARNCDLELSGGLVVESSSAELVASRRVSSTAGVFSAGHGLLDLSDRPGNRLRQVSRTVTRHDDVVLDSDPKILVGQIDARLHRDHRARLERTVRSDVVDLESKMVPDAMDEVVPVSGLVDDVSRGF